MRVKRHSSTRAQRLSATTLLSHLSCTPRFDVRFAGFQARGANNQAVPEQDYQPNRPRRRYVWFLLASAVLAATSAVIWPSNALQLWSFAQSLPSSLADQTASRSSAGSAEPLKELDALTKKIIELRDWQQQISAEITALQSAQEELQRSSVKAMSWYSEPNALLHQQAAPKPRDAALRNGSWCVPACSEAGSSRAWSGWIHKAHRPQ
jgi:hypothetical protein